jgi:hypothetical protein
MEEPSPLRGGESRGKTFPLSGRGRRVFFPWNPPFEGEGVFPRDSFPRRGGCFPWDSPPHRGGGFFHRSSAPPAPGSPSPKEFFPGILLPEGELVFPRDSPSPRGIFSSGIPFPERGGGFFHSSSAPPEAPPPRGRVFSPGFPPPKGRMFFPGILFSEGEGALPPQQCPTSEGNSGESLSCVMRDPQIYLLEDYVNPSEALVGANIQCGFIDPLPP